MEDKSIEERLKDANKQLEELQREEYTKIYYEEFLKIKPEFDEIFATAENLKEKKDYEGIEKIVKIIKDVTDKYKKIEVEEKVIPIKEEEEIKEVKKKKKLI